MAPQKFSSSVEYALFHSLDSSCWLSSGFHVLGISLGNILRVVASCLFLTLYHLLELGCLDMDLSQSPEGPPSIHSVLIVSVAFYFYDDFPDKLFLIWLLHSFVKVHFIFIHFGGKGYCVRNFIIYGVALLHNGSIEVFLFCGVCLVPFLGLFLLAIFWFPCLGYKPWKYLKGGCILFVSYLVPSS